MASDPRQVPGSSLNRHRREVAALPEGWGLACAKSAQDDLRAVARKW